MNLIINSRDIKYCCPELQDKWPVIWSMAREIKIFITLTSTARSYKVQYALYAQGRQKMDYVNLLRKDVGLDPISFTANQKKVTWTLKSRHLVDLEDSEQSNDYSTAFDFVVLNERTPIWNVKASYGGTPEPDYLEVGRIGESLGLVWGGRFSTPDMVHFQTKAIKS